MASIQDKSALFRLLGRGANLAFQHSPISRTSLAFLFATTRSGRDLVFHESFCRANYLPLLKPPFQECSTEIGQCPFFSGGEPFKLGPHCLTNPYADLDSPLAHVPNLSSIRMICRTCWSRHTTLALPERPVGNLADCPVDSRRELRADPKIGVRGSAMGVKPAFRTRGQKRAKRISYWLRRGFGNRLRRVSSRKQRTQGELRPQWEMDKFSCSHRCLL
jgi:hypothetical protein